MKYRIVKKRKIKGIGAWLKAKYTDIYVIEKETLITFLMYGEIEEFLEWQELKTNLIPKYFDTLENAKNALEKFKEKCKEEEKYNNSLYEIEF